MPAIKIIIGVFLLLAGLLYFYSPSFVMRLNLILREVICSDRAVLLYHKKIALILFVFSFILLYMGLSTFDYPVTPAENAKILAMKSYHEGNYRESIRHTYLALAHKPDEEWALVHIASLYSVLQDEQKAIPVWKKVISLYPNNKLAQRVIYDKNKRKN